MDDAVTPDPGEVPAGTQIDRRKGHMHKEAATQLRARILSGELPPGERLREVQLSQQFNISRTPIREALRTLAAEGLVELLPNRSVVVSSVSADEVNDLWLVFAEIEALAARLACERVTDAEITEIGRYLSEMVDCHSSGERGPYLKLNQQIHQRTVEIAANPVLLSVWQSLAPKIERARALPNLDPQRWSAALLEHSKMFTALAARDGAKLASLTREHFLAAMPYVTRTVRMSAPGGV